MKAISIKQPWAWLIANGHKDIENRTWKTNYRGEVMIHTGKSMDMQDYRNALVIARKLGITLPAPADLPTGGYVGKVTITGVVIQSDSPWFFGPVGFTLSDATVIPFEPAKGKLNVYNIS